MDGLGLLHLALFHEFSDGFQLLNLPLESRDHAVNECRQRPHVHWHVVPVQHPVYVDGWLVRRSGGSGLLADRGSLDSRLGRPLGLLAAFGFAAAFLRPCTAFAGEGERLSVSTAWGGGSSGPEAASLLPTDSPSARGGAFSDHSPKCWRTRVR